MFVMLRKDWPDKFRRSVFDKKGERIAVLEWSPGDRMEITDKLELAAIKDDIGKALVEVKPPVTKADPEKVEPPTE